MAWISLNGFYDTDEIEGNAIVNKCVLGRLDATRAIDDNFMIQEIGMSCGNIKKDMGKYTHMFLDFTRGTNDLV